VQHEFGHRFGLAHSSLLLLDDVRSRRSGDHTRSDTIKLAGLPAERGLAPLFELATWAARALHACHGHVWTPICNKCTFLCYDPTHHGHALLVAGLRQHLLPCAPAGHHGAQRSVGQRCHPGQLLGQVGHHGLLQGRLQPVQQVKRQLAQSPAPKCADMSG
jgi:hypothetical protein